MQVCYVLPKELRRWNAVTDDIATIEDFVIFAKEVAESGNLTGAARKEDITASFEFGANVME